jgi:hypothetical protein
MTGNKLIPFAGTHNYQRTTNNYIWHILDIGTVNNTLEIQQSWQSTLKTSCSKDKRISARAVKAA